VTVLVYPCGGGSPAGRLATDVALELDRRGLAETSSIACLAGGSASVVDDAGPGRAAITIDGCAFACATKALEVRGVSPASTVQVEDALGAGGAAELSPSRRRAAVQRILRRLEPGIGTASGSGGSTPTGRSRSRRRGPAGEYLRAVASLSECRGSRDRAEAPVSAAELARLLGVSRSSAGENLARLEGSGLVTRARGRRVLLTAAGRRAAERERRRYATAERLLVEFVGCAPGEARTHAGPLAAALDDEAAGRIELALRRRRG
jgi:Mn-dependent DtxR family transcriptional regulator/uncharacterized metal-binding protein